MEYGRGKANTSQASFPFSSSRLHTYMPQSFHRGKEKDSDDKGHVLAQSDKTGKAHPPTRVLLNGSHRTTAGNQLHCIFNRRFDTRREQQLAI